MARSDFEYRRNWGIAMQTVNQLLRGKGNQIYSVAPTDSVLHAIEIMATRHVGALLVMNQGTLAGIISERDYARKVILKNRSSHDTPVSEIMTSPADHRGPDGYRAPLHATHDRAPLPASAGGGVRARGRHAVDRRPGEGGDRGAERADRAARALHRRLSLRQSDLLTVPPAPYHAVIHRRARWRLPAPARVQGPAQNPAWPELSDCFRERSLRFQGAGYGVVRACDMANDENTRGEAATHRGVRANVDARSHDWGLYRPAYERDSCGFGLIASLDDRASHWVVQTAITSLNRLTHRGAIATDGKTGDGCGLLIKMPTRFLRAVAQEAGFTLGLTVRGRPGVPQPRSGQGSRGAARAHRRDRAREIAGRRFPRGQRRSVRLRRGGAQVPAAHRTDFREFRRPTSTSRPSTAGSTWRGADRRKSSSRTIRCSTSRPCRRAPSSTRAW